MIAVQPPLRPICVNADVCGTETDVQSESKTGVEASFFSCLND